MSNHIPLVAIAIVAIVGNGCSGCFDSVGGADADADAGADSRDAGDSDADSMDPDVADGTAETGTCSPHDSGMGQTDAGSDIALEVFLRRAHRHLGCSTILECGGKAGLHSLATLRCHPDVADDFGSPYEDLPDTRGMRFTYEPTEAARCLAQLRGADACELVSQQTRRRESPLTTGACAKAIVGQQSDGSPCSRDLECSGDLICIRGDSCPGTCQARRSIGETCTSHRHCSNDLYCNDDNKCARRPTAGETCDGNTPCQPGAYCDISDRTCRMLPGGSGETCRIGFGGDNCPGSLVCVRDKCGRGAEVGESCQTGSEPCVPDARCIDGTCREIAGPGQCCDESTTCMYPYYCSDGHCKPRPTIGGDCSDPSPRYAGDSLSLCLRGRCESGTCVQHPTKSKGEECMEGTCADGLYCDASGPETTCVDRKQAGDACTVDDCASGLECREKPSGDQVCMTDCVGL